MRAIWKGAVSFGLVNIPVGVYSATRAGKEIKFRLLRESDHSPIKYKRVAETDGKEVAWDQIVKGYEHQKDEFIILKESDFKQVNLESTQTVDIKEFVDVQDIDPMFFDEPYFLAPEKGGAKAYALLREALKNSGKVGIAKVVLKTREHLAAVKPHGKALVLELMHFADELADPADLELPNGEIGKKELTMAQTLIDTMSGKWKPELYHDQYRQAVMALIEEKIAAGGDELPARKPKRRTATNVVDLVSVLQESLNRTSKKKPAKTAEKKPRKAA
jgi:DNA end-binding protein Ku